MKRYIVLLIGCLLFMIACNNNSETEKHPDFSKKTIDISNKITDVKTNLILGQSEIKIIGKYLLLKNSSSLDKGFHLFNKKTFKYIACTGSVGQGPGQIISYRNAVMLPNTADNKSFYVFDYSQLTLYKYAIDSILNNPNYLPEEILKMYNDRVFGDVNTLNDSIFCGVSARMINSHSFVNEVAFFNIKTGKITKISSINTNNKEKARETHSKFALFPTKDKYVQAYSNVDLLTIHDINGKLLCNIYGSSWNSNKKNFEFYEQVKVGKKHIIAKYLGGLWYTKDNNKRFRGVFASKLLVFDTKGNYKKTLKFGEEIRDFCLDEDNNRIIITYLNRDEPLAYLDLNGILD